MHQDERPSEILNRPRELADAFDRIGSGYEARPGYPEWVFQTLTDHCGLRDGATVLEVGAGVGQATLELLERGARLTAVEPGAALARRLMERTSGRDIEVVVSTLEDFDPPEAEFDLAISATGFHWIDPLVGFTKFARGLRDHGWLALWWTIWQDPDRPDPFGDALEPALAARAPHLLDDEAGPRAYMKDLDARLGEVARLDSYGPVTREVLHWEGEHDPVSLRRMFGTFAGWIALEDSVRSELLDQVERLARDEFGGLVRRPYQTIFYRTQRRARTGSHRGGIQSPSG